MTMVYRIPDNTTHVDTVDYGQSGDDRRRLPVREFGRSFSARKDNADYALEQARRDGERFLQRMAEACPVLYSTDVVAEIGPHVDVLRRFTLVGWRIQAASPTFEFMLREFPRTPAPETLWQHAKRACREWWGRQRGRVA